MKYIVLLLGLFFISCAYAQPYYADLSMVVDVSGETSIGGTTNYPTLEVSTSDQFTTKKASYWTFNLTTNDTFADYIIMLELPAESEITYMKSAGTIRILNQNGIKIITTGTQKPISIVVQYIQHQSEKNSVLYILGSILIGIIIIGSFYITYKKLKNSLSLPIHNKTVSYNAQKLKAIRSTLTENQQKILDLLLEETPLTQKQLLHRSKLPKATLSRNISTMEKKNILKKQSRGLTNVICINDELLT